jgi:hypothetical protein
MSTALPATISLRRRSDSLLGRSRCSGAAFSAPSWSRAGSQAAARAARRAAAMKFGRPESAMTGGFAEPTAASDAATRSAADGGVRERPAAKPGSRG